MTIDNVTWKYNMSIDDVLNVQAMYGGPTTIVTVLSDRMPKSPHWNSVEAKPSPSNRA